MLRHAVNHASGALFGAHVWSTLFVHITGSFTMGVLVGWCACRGEGSGPSLRLFLTTGMLGGFTTFATFALDTALFWQCGQVWGTAGSVGGSVLAGVLSLCAGLARVRGLTP